MTGASALRAARAVALVLVTVAAGGCAAEARACAHRLDYYGTYSLGTKAGGIELPLRARVDELRDLGGNMLVASGRGTAILDLLPPGMLAVPGCGLMQREDWQIRGRWDERRARARLAELAKDFADHPRVYGVCITHEVEEYADHDRRRWMYRLAREYFPHKKIIHYYGHLWDDRNPLRRRVDGYGLRGEVETDVVFLSLPATQHGQFHLANVATLEHALRLAARTPGVPVWGQTSINADHHYVRGRDSMLSIWGAHGENMTRWTDRLLAVAHRDARGNTLRLSAFFWRSLGRFSHDLGHPAFASQRARVRAIADGLCLSNAGQRPT